MAKRRKFNPESKTEVLIYAHPHLVFIAESLSRIQFNVFLNAFSRPNLPI